MNCNFVNRFKIMLQLILQTDNKVIYMGFRGVHDIKIVRENHGGKISIFQVSKANSRLFPGFFQVSQIPGFFQVFQVFQVAENPVPSSVITKPKYLKLLTCSILCPSTVM